MTLFEAGGDDMGWLSDTTTSCASTISTLKSDIIEAWKKEQDEPPETSMEAPQEEEGGS
jgi:hypothetical protein